MARLLTGISRRSGQFWMASVAPGQRWALPKSCKRKRVIDCIAVTHTHRLPHELATASCLISPSLKRVSSSGAEVCASTASARSSCAMARTNLDCAPPGETASALFTPSLRRKRREPVAGPSLAPQACVRPCAMEAKGAESFSKRLFGGSEFVDTSGGGVRAPRHFLRHTGE
jgi:hypothetical protein